MDLHKPPTSALQIQQVILKLLSDVDAFLDSGEERREIGRGMVTPYELDIINIREELGIRAIVYQIVIDDAWKENGIFTALRKHLEAHPKISSVVFASTTSPILRSVLPKHGYEYWPPTENNLRKKIK